MSSHMASTSSQRKASIPAWPCRSFAAWLRPRSMSLCFQKGINLAKTPVWQRRGVMVYRKDGRVVADWQPPLFSSAEGKGLLEQILCL